MRALLFATALGLLLIATPLAGVAAEATLAAKPGASDGLPSPRPDLRTVKKSAFPFKPWSYAKAYTYNFFEDRPVQMQIISNGKWSEHVRSQQVIPDKTAQAAAQLAAGTRGTIETTKCTFPRHAIVYFDREDQPIASIDVCFTCEAVLAWPDYPKPENYDWERATKRLEKALPRWRQLFERDLGLPIDYKTAPAP